MVFNPDYCENTVDPVSFAVCIETTITRFVAHFLAARFLLQRISVWFIRWCVCLRYFLCRRNPLELEWSSLISSSLSSYVVMQSSLGSVADTEADYICTCSRSNRTYIWTSYRRGARKYLWVQSSSIASIGFTSAGSNRVHQKNPPNR